MNLQALKFDFYAFCAFLRLYQKSADFFGIAYNLHAALAFEYSGFEFYLQLFMDQKNLLTKIQVFNSKGSSKFERYMCLNKKEPR